MSKFHFWGGLSVNDWDKHEKNFTTYIWKELGTSKQPKKGTRSWNSFQLFKRNFIVPEVPQKGTCSCPALQGLNILFNDASYFSETDLGRNNKFQCIFPGKKLEKLHLFIIFSEIRNHKNFKINQSTCFFFTDQNWYVE